MPETILARLPTTEKPKTEKPKGVSFDKKKAIQRMAQLYEQRQPYIDRWKSIRDYQLPYVGEFESEKNNRATRRDTKILNGAAWESAQIFASGVMSGLTPPSRQWFKLAFSRSEMAEDIQIAAILDERQEILYSVFARSNFYNAVHDRYQELPFGQSPLGIFPSFETGVHFVPFTIGTYALGVGKNGVVNTFAHKMTMTAAQLVEKFGYDNVSEQVQRALKDNNNQSTKFDVCMLVEPNDNYKDGSISNKEMPYRILYWEDKAQSDKWLEVSGSKEFPIPVARFLVNGLEPYGKGAGWFAEADSKMLQALEKDLLSAIQLQVRPPLQADTETANKGVNLIPGATNTATTANGQGIKPIYQPNIDMSGIHEKIMKTEGSIKRLYAADLFMMLDQIEKGQMTAREVMERTQEKLQQLAPVVERLQFEFLSPIIERVYNILERSGAFPEFPPEALEALQGEELKIEYISPLAQAQKLSGLIAIEQAFSFVASIAQMYPEALDKLNPVEAVDKYYEWLGGPAAIRRSDEEVAQIQAQRQQAMAQQQQAGAMAAAAQPAKDYAQAAKVMNEAVGSGQANVIGSIMGV